MTGSLQGMDYGDARVLVTGATGFIGAALVEALLAAGATVHGASRQRPVGDERGGVRFHVADLADRAACRTLIGDVRPDIVFHMASHVSGRQDLETVATTFSGNLAAQVNLLSAVAEQGGVRSVVTAGSSEEPRTFAHGVTTTAPSSPYAAAKLGASAYGALFRHTFGLPVTHARIFMGYGPGQSDRLKLVPYVTLELLRGRVPKLSSGHRLADFTFIDDIVSGLMTLGQRPDIETLDLGTGRLTSVGEIATRIKDIVAPSAGLAFGATPDRLNETELAADVARSAALAGWRADVSLDEGLRRTVEWYKARLDELMPEV